MKAELAKLCDLTEHHHSLTIALCDTGTLHYSCMELHSGQLPTVKLYPATQKKEPLEFFGEPRAHSAERYLKFLVENGAFKHSLINNTGEAALGSRSPEGVATGRSDL